MPSNNCPICGMQANVAPNANHTSMVVGCPRCGDFALLGQAFDLPEQWKAGKNSDRTPEGRFAASHAIRRMQAPSHRPEISVEQLRQLWSMPFPNPQQQADYMILVLGDAGLPLDTYLYKRAEAFCAVMGTRDEPLQGKTGGFFLVINRLTEQKLIEHDKYPPAPNVGYRLTFDGWMRYEELRRAHVDSKVAFMAMGYGNAALDKVVTEHFMPAVKETGFDLFRLDSRPKAGLIDNRMRVLIRSAKFIVCDLTEENRGAYWEAGFAEGAQKPVFYTCEKSKFDAAKSHFDTEHMFTVRWDVKNPALAAEELKAAIRNEFPLDASQPTVFN
jgi:hypothetical protein